jgi:hypothetical protein
MAKIKWHILAQNDLMRKHGAEIVQSQYTKNVQSRLKDKVDLGSHENHDWEPTLGNFGPHKGKIICKTCGDKFVTWLSKQHVRLIRQQ